VNFDRNSSVIVGVFPISRFGSIIWNRWNCVLCRIRSLPSFWLLADRSKKEAGVKPRNEVGWRYSVRPLGLALTGLIWNTTPKTVS
jgi:hypothetical protein